MACRDVSEDRIGHGIESRQSCTRAASAGGPAVLSLHADRLGAFLQEARLIDDQHAILLPKMLDHRVSEVVPYRILIPVRTIEQALHPLRSGLTQMFG